MSVSKPRYAYNNLMICRHAICFRHKRLSWLTGGAARTMVKDEMSKLFTVLEPLEARQLFAGVTLVTHGWKGRLQGFVDTAADFIAGRLGGPSHVATYVMDIEPTAEGFLYVNSVTHRDGTAK